MSNTLQTISKRNSFKKCGTVDVPRNCLQFDLPEDGHRIRPVRLSTKSDFLHKNQRKMPYGMLQGMQKKSKDRYNAQREQDRNLGIVAESGRSKKLMQTYFEAKENVRREEKRMNLNTDRGLNLHRYTQAKYRDGALNFSKRAV